MSLARPSFPSTCIAVLLVSRGIKKILHAPAAIDPAAVLRGSGNDDVSGIVSNSAKIPTFAAVSPNLNMSNEFVVKMCISVHKSGYTQVNDSACSIPC